VTAPKARSTLDSSQELRQPAQVRPESALERSAACRRICAWSSTFATPCPLFEPDGECTQVGPRWPRPVSCQHFSASKSRVQALTGPDRLAVPTVRGVGCLSQMVTRQGQMLAQSPAGMTPAVAGDS